MQTKYQQAIRYLCFPILLGLSMLTAGCASAPQPQPSSKQILVFAYEALSSSLSMNFVTYQVGLQEASRYFTPRGLADYRLAVKKLGVVDQCLKEEMNVSVAQEHAPVIIDTDVANSPYSWKVQLPMVIEYENTSKALRQHVLFTVRVVTMAGKDKGLAIDQLSMGKRLKDSVHY